MPTPHERLSKILKSREPAVVKFKRNPLVAREGAILLEAVTVKESSFSPASEDLELYELLKGSIYESWDADNERYVINATVASLWDTILYALQNKYEATSTRCDATKRKTVNFIKKIKIDDKLLSEFVLQTFIRVQSKSYNSVSTKDRELLFEQFDSLRRTFGKRV